MPFEKLSRTDLANLSSGSGGRPEYVEFLKSLRSGEGGRITTEAAGTTKQTIKNRLTTAAKTAGVTVKFRRSPADEVLFAISKG